MKNFRPEDLKHSIAKGESALLEFKRDWYNFEDKKNKAEFVKDVLAMANSVGEKDPGVIIIGVEDPSRTGQIVGTIQQPSPESVSQILSSYTTPVVSAQCRHHTIDAKTVSVVEVSWQPARPHTSIRDYPGVLQRDVVYCRRDITIGIMTIPEIATMIRNSDAKLGSVTDRPILRAGFVQAANWNAPNVVMQLTNLTDQPIAGVEVVLDAALIQDPQTMTRIGLLTNRVLQPRQSQELEHDVRKFSLLRDGQPVQRPSEKLYYKWLEVTMHVRYRDVDGLIRQINQTISLSD